MGFDWTEISAAFDKVTEEQAELREQCAEETVSTQRIEEEMGDLLFSCVNVARFLDIDPESSLNYTIDKFMRRFRHIEERATALGRNLEDMSLNEMDELWEEAKGLENKV